MHGSGSLWDLQAGGQRNRIAAATVASAAGISHRHDGDGFHAGLIDLISPHGFADAG
jgi:hypothetical protein